MKSILIKLGKAIDVIRRDGIIHGGKRVAGYLVAFFKLIFQEKSGDILIITGGVGDSALYRTQHYAEELNLHGFESATMVQDNPFLPKLADKFKIFIFHRVLWTPTVKKFVEKIKSQNKEIIFETDDLVFDPKYFCATEQYKSINFLQKKQYEKGVGEEILKDEYTKVCTCTTSYLAKELEKYPARNTADVGGGKKVFIVQNKLSNKDLEIIGKIKNSKLIQNSELKIKNSDIVRIGYFSGTGSHNKDFASITDALFKILEKFSNVELFLAGPLDVENKLNKFKDRIKQIPYVPRAKHFENISQIDINLAPLEMNNPFCEAKSELKFFEAGILEVPTVAVRNQTFSEAIANGENGFLASSTEEWIDKIGKLITDENLRKSMGEKAREKSLKDYTNKNSHNEEYYKYLRNKL